MQNEQIVQDSQIAGVVRVIGLEAFLQLVKAYGGSSIYIPSAATSAAIVEQWLLRGGVPHAG